jgi:RHS repeat-associated protein
MEGNWNGASADAKNKYQYNGKELQSDFGLDWNDYGARMYDAAIGRWNATDPLAEKTLSWNPYHYTLNNPVMLIDPTGMEAEFDKSGNLTRATGKDAANWLRGQQKAMDKAAESKEKPESKLRGVTVTVTDKIVGTGTLIGYPADASEDRGQRNGQKYELPLYDVIVSGTDENGTTIERHFSAFRYGIKLTDADKKKGRPAQVVGLSQKQSYKLQWTFMPHFGENAWNITGAFYIHRGPDIPKSDWGSNGCIEISGNKGWDNFTNTIHGLTGTNDDSLISKQKLLTVVIQPCIKPPLKKAN